MKSFALFAAAVLPILTVTTILLGVALLAWFVLPVIPWSVAIPLAFLVGIVWLVRRTAHRTANHH